MDIDQNFDPKFGLQIVRENKAIFLLLSLGLFGVGMGMWLFWQGSSSTDVMIVRSGSEATGSAQLGSVIVDVSGSVIKPGVFTLPPHSRVIDALEAAGGLSEAADQFWITKYINRAERVTDGAKIYVPSVDEDFELQMQMTGQNQQAKAISRVNINTANQAELESLWGVGEATAEAIINGRPYQRLEELLEKKIVRQNVWDRNKEVLSL